MNPARPAHLTRINVGVKEGFSLVEGPGDALAIWESVSTASQLWTADLLLIAHL